MPLAKSLPESTGVSHRPLIYCFPRRLDGPLRLSSGRVLGRLHGGSLFSGSLFTVPSRPRPPLIADCTHLPKETHVFPDFSRLCRPGPGRRRRDGPGPSGVLFLRRRGLQGPHRITLTSRRPAISAVAPGRRPHHRRPYGAHGWRGDDQGGAPPLAVDPGHSADHGGHRRGPPAGPGSRGQRLPAQERAG